MTGPLRRLVGFADALRAAGLVIGPERLALAAEALSHVDEIGRDGPYWPLRFAFCSRRDELPVFNAVYAGWFVTPPEPAALVPGNGVTAPATGGDAATGGPGAQAGRFGGSSDDAALSGRDVALLSESELARVREWIGMLRLVPPTRRAMRRKRARSGAVDIGRTMRLMVRHHGELPAVRRRQRAVRPRRLLLLVDISGSMRPYSDLFLRFSYAALAAHPRHTEVVAIGAEWRPLTTALRARHANDAMRAVAAVETAWDRGTTLGVALHGLLKAWGGRTAIRSATAVIFSDGFEFDDQTLLREQIARLSRLVGTLIWVDPLRRAPHQKAADRNLEIAQAYAAVRLPGHNFDALRTLAKVIHDG